MNYDWERAVKVYWNLTETQIASIDYLLRAQKKIRERNEKIDIKRFGNVK